jgi:hypothetical protein
MDNIRKSNAESCITKQQRLNKAYQVKK